MSRFSGFVGPWYATFGVESQKAINLYPERVESSEGKNDAVLRGTPGHADWGLLPTTPVRGLLAAGSASAQRLFAVGGSKLYEVSSIGVPTLLGDVGNDAANSPVQMELNGSQLFIVSAGNSYCDNGAGPVSTGVSAKTGCYIDGYFIVSKPNSRNFKISALEDGTTWAADPIDLQAKGGYPDHLGTVLADHSQLWLLGEERSEVWQHTGAADFPFERNPSGSIHQGIGSATWAVCRLMNGVAWLGQDSRGKLTAWWAQGFTPKRISNYSIEKEFDFIGTASDITSFSQVVNGHHFWWICGPNATWVFDATTGWWHQRAWWNGAANERHRARCHAFCFERHLIGDHTTGKIHQMSDSYGSDGGVKIRRVRQSPYVGNEDVRIFHHEFRLDFTTDASATPTVFLMYSADNGVTWSTAQTLVGTAGFKHYASFRRLGSGRSRMYQIWIEVDSCVSIVNAFLDAAKGDD